MGWKRGSIVMEAKPFAHVVCAKFRQQRCNFCLHSAEGMKKCGACKRMWYCGVPCQKEDWKIHKVECQIMKKVPDTPTDCNSLYLRLVIKYLAGAASKRQTKDEYPCVRSFNEMISHSENIKVDPLRAQQFQETSDFLRTYADGILRLPNDDTLLEIFGRMVVNMHTIAGEMLQDVGYAVYPSPAVFDHRCWGNAITTFDGRKMVVRAVDNIPSDSVLDVFVNYVEPIATTAERQEHLQQQYYFTCTCGRCQNKEVDAMMTSTEGSNEGDLKRVKDCLEKVDEMKNNAAKAKDILNMCQQCLDEVKLPFGNVFLGRLVVKTFHVAIDAEEWEAAFLLGTKTKSHLDFSIHPFNPYVGYLLANMGKLLMKLERLPEAHLHLTKAKENFIVSLGENHFLYRQVHKMLMMCEAEMENQGGGDAAPQLSG